MVPNIAVTTRKLSAIAHEKVRSRNSEAATVARARAAGRQMKMCHQHSAGHEQRHHQS